MRIRPFLPLPLLAGALLAAAAASPFDSALALYRARDFPAARAAFARLAAAEPTNAAACYYLGLTLSKRGDAHALEEAVPWLEKASRLAPANAGYLADYGGTALQLAAQSHAFGTALRGRDAMERSLVLDPANLDAREGLYRFYLEAPWPLGSSAKARAQLEEIRRRDPDRGTVLEIAAKADAKDYAGAFALADQALSRRPDDYAALYQYGRVALASGTNLERGLDCLRKCQTLPPSSPAQPGHAVVWSRIGALQEKLGHPAEARIAYESALRLDPANGPAAAALARLK